MPRYEDRIERSLTRARENAPRPERIDIDALRLVVFSDHHRGLDDGADDFRPCKAAYHAALRHYAAAGFALYLLGDVEELWEGRPARIIETYRDTLRLERVFVAAGRYTRIAGNHDDLWQYQSQVDRYLKPFIADAGGIAEVLHAQVITVTSAGRELGEFFFVHGHHGTTDADRFARLSRLVVRYLWRQLQRMTGIRATTPATDFVLRLRHESAMHRWASKQKGVVLISGHTHHPVFMSESHESHLRSIVAKLAAAAERTADPVKQEEIRKALEQKTAQLGRILERSKGVFFHLNEHDKPCFFNAGCCSFADGDITGIEISEGRIRLVRWRRPPAGPRKKILREDRLEAVLDRCR
jgi:UDP-2,3-diacylglucosamine pyrophosphatase LpxH